MRLFHFVLRLLLPGTLVLSGGVTYGQDYPNKPIRIVGSEPGGGGDFLARLVAQGIAAPLGQQVIVENRPGVTPGQIVSQAQPDGYTLLIFGNGIWLGPLLQKWPYDPVRDLAPITIATSAPCIIVAHPSMAANSVKELIALAKAKPGGLNYAGGVTGSMNHLAGELFKAMAGVSIVTIPYKGSGPAINDVIAGQVPLFFGTPGGVVQHIKSGRLKALGVTGAKPFALMPELPTVAATLPGYQAISVFGVWAPARTPGPVINRLNQEIVRLLSRPDAKEKLFNVGVEPVGSSPQEFAAAIKSEMMTMGKVIKDAGIRTE